MKAKVALFTFIDDVYKREHIDIGDMQDHGSNTGQDKITESTVELDLNKLTLDKLTDFMNALEHGYPDQGEEDPAARSPRRSQCRRRLHDDRGLCPRRPPHERPP